MQKSFTDKCYELLAQIPPGRVTTYSEMARAAGNSKGARAVGNAMAKNPNAPQVPCHRVVKSDGSLGGYAFGLARKVELLALEGVQVENGKVVDFENRVWEFA